MEKLFKEVDPVEINENVFHLINDTWFLLTAGTLTNFNTMTASWGSLGILWNKPVAFAFVRPQRHTYGFMEQAERFTLSFLSEEYRPALKYCGKYSGRDVDKILNTGLIPLGTKNGSVTFEQSSLVLECRKLYFSDLDASHFLDPKIIKNYPLNDFHRMYIGGIEHCLVKK
ncbi:MAG: flavin reductase [Bacteroidetes bacterium]|nr:flavin reductase [Bacteroidota bacterium]